MLLKLGKAWKGNADLKAIRTIISLAMIPVIIELLFYVISVVIGNSLNLEIQHPVISIIIRLFTFNIMVLGISMIQGFPHMQSMIYLSVPGILFSLIYMIIKY